MKFEHYLIFLLLPLSMSMIETDDCLCSTEFQSNKIASKNVIFFSWIYHIDTDIKSICDHIFNAIALKLKSKSWDDEIFMQMKLKSIFYANICLVQLNSIWISGAYSHLKSLQYCSNIHIQVNFDAKGFALKIYKKFRFKAKNNCF